MKTRCFVIGLPVLLSACLLASFYMAVGCAAQLDGSSCDRQLTGRVTLPLDDGGHVEPVEWWYWTGHLQADDGHWFGFQEVFFQFRQAPISMRLVNFAVTDLESQSFHFRGMPDFNQPPEQPASGFDHSLSEFSATGGSGSDHLRGTVDGYQLDLNLEELKPAVGQHMDGYTDYAFGGYTYYYSRTRMQVQGTLTRDGQARGVTGTAWFDHQWGELSQVTAKGWDWFGIQLDDGREIMLFMVHDPDGLELLGGTLVDASCSSRELPEEAIQVRPLGEWRSPETACVYPSGWDLTVEELKLRVEPVLADQELSSAHKTYWEGAALVSGDASGRAYVELTGYCD